MKRLTAALRTAPRPAVAGLALVIVSGLALMACMALMVMGAPAFAPTPQAGVPTVGIALIQIAGVLWAAGIVITGLWLPDAAILLRRAFNKG